MQRASVRTSETSKPMISDRAFGLVALLAVLPVFFAFAVAGQPARGRAAAISAGIIIAVARFTWEQRKCIWYWMTISCFACVHTAVVLLATWQEKRYPGFVLLPIATADFAVMYGVIRFIEALFKARNRHSGGPRTFDKDDQY
jgi:hypothetical protein